MTSSSLATVARSPMASSQLRSLLWSTFAGADVDEPGDGALDWLDSAELVLGELVGNAVRHGHGPTLRVRLRRDPDTLRIAVQDGSPDRPVRREAAWDDESGRGLMIIEALSARWGWRPMDGGKVVWADVSC